MEKVYSLVEQELQLISNCIENEIKSPISLINDVCKHLVTSGGKKLRPLTVLLGAKCFEFSNQSIINLATVIEFFHISSLLHDDVVDNSSLRRGKKTVHTIWGNKTSILVGDYIFSKAFQLLAKINNQRILTLLANTSNIITQGEIQQIVYANNSEISINDYMKIIHQKTAILFETAAQMGPIMANKSEEDICAMANFGHYLGRAFQIIDDILDYQSPSTTLGKNIGNDLSEGNITIPLIYALQNGNTAQQALIRNAIKNASIESLEQINETIHLTNAIQLSFDLAEKQINLAVTHLLKIEPSVYRDALEKLALFVLERNY